MLSDATMNDAKAVGDSRATTDDIRQIFTRLAACGFRFDDPALCYLDKRPDLVAFE
jgi:hypothetical protein